MATRRQFIEYISVLPAIMGFPSLSHGSVKQEVIKPRRLSQGDTIGLIMPASAPFEIRQTIIEATEKMHNLGFEVKLGQNVYQRMGYLAGSDEQRVSDIHDMFQDKTVQAIISVRGGYGSHRLLKYLDYQLIKRNPKIFLGYSDITSLLLAIHKMTGLITFHGPVAVSTFTEYTQKYFYKTLTRPEPVGLIEDAPYDENLQTTNRIITIKSGKAKGRLVGGNLTLICTTIGTPYEIETKDRILFLEDVGEEPHDIDRYLTHLDNAGKLESCAGIVFDRMEKVRPADYKPGYYTNLSKEDVIFDRLKSYDFPCCMGLSLGHVADKPTLPLGVLAEMDADIGRLSLLESAVS
jgi:muramoyltetrapeptide carboxypeptidase